MRGLSSLERVILECIGKQSLNYDEIKHQTGLQENACFNVLQALTIRGILRPEGYQYKINENISPKIMEEINGLDSRKAESLELIEAVLDQNQEKIFRFSKVAMDSHDEKIFIAMLSNLDSFLKDANRKAQSSTPMKDRKVIFWGMGDVQKLMNQVILGK